MVCIRLFHVISKRNKLIENKSSNLQPILNQCPIIRMRVITKIFFLIVIFLSFGLNSQAQNKKMELSFTSGFVINHWELGTEYQEFASGGHIGFNLYTKKAKRFKKTYAGL